MTATPNDNLSDLNERLAEMPNARVLRNLASEPAPSSEPVSFRGRPQGRGEDHAETPNPDGPMMKADQTSTSFLDLGHVLEQRSREWTAMVRHLEQHRHHLASVESEQNAAYEQLERIVPVVQETFRSLRTAIEAKKAGTPGAEIEEVAAVNTRALEELERLAGSLSTQALWYRSAWEQYSRTAESAQRLRSHMEAPHIPA